MSGDPTKRTVKTGRNPSALLTDIEIRFKAFAGSDEKIDRAELQTGLELNDADYADRIFRLVDKDGSGDITVWEFIEFAKILVEGSDDDKLRIIFDLHDLNGDGTIDPDELRDILDRSLNEHSLDIPDRKLSELSEALFRSVDTDGSGAISFAEFRACIDNHPTLKKQMIDTAATWLKLPHRIASERRKPGRIWRAFVDNITQFWENDRSWPALLLLYTAANVWMFRQGLLIEAANGSDMATQIAQGAAEALKLNGALILVSMLRHTLTFLRRTPLGGFLPLDHAISFHKVIGHTAFALALVHVGGYITAYESMVDPDFFTREVIYGELVKSQVGWTGLSLIGVFLLIWIFSQEFVRRKGMFELFFQTHRLFWAWFILFMLHVPDFWMWVVGPGTLFLIEQGVRMFQGRRPAEVEVMDALPSNVTRLTLKRPDWFKYQPGEYVYLRHPAISKREWHPFTVTSNPEDESKLELHVRSVGTWTRRLNTLAAKPAEERVDIWQQAYLDGPYGSPSADIFGSSVPVLIGAGIGVTPFASILRSILHRKRQGDESLVDLKKVYFVWLNRDQQAFEWFVDLMAELESDPETRDLIDTRVHLTGLRAELTSASLTVAMEVYHQETGRDLLTGLRAQTQLDRPNWHTVLGAIREAHPEEKVDVFFCGPQTLSHKLARESARFGFGYKKENF